jgi:hypothetical protein
MKEKWENLRIMLSQKKFEESASRRIEPSNVHCYLEIKDER